MGKTELDTRQTLRYLREDEVLVRDRFILQKGTIGGTCQYGARGWIRVVQRQNFIIRQRGEPTKQSVRQVGKRDIIQGLRKRSGTSALNKSVSQTNPVRSQGITRPNSNQSTRSISC